MSRKRPVQRMYVIQYPTQMFGTPAGIWPVWVRRTAKRVTIVIACEEAREALSYRKWFTPDQARRTLFNDRAAAYVKLLADIREERSSLQEDLDFWKDQYKTVRANRIQLITEQEEEEPVT